MIKITDLASLDVCECGHIRREHSSWGSCCYRMIHRKERRRNAEGKYKVYKTNYQCCCKEFKKLEETK